MHTGYRRNERRARVRIRGMAKKPMKADDVSRIVGPIVEAIGSLGVKIDQTNERLDQTIGRLDHLEEGQRALLLEQRATTERIGRLERAVIGIGRMTALESRVARLEERAGVEPPR